MARAGLGGDARVDDTGSWDQHHRALLNQKAFLTFISFCAFCG
jgi:hypothetical protein